ncbi:flagellar hook-basal body complex protein [Desulfovibrio sp. OttesenSCG-928-G15]|nr:flagellar hook-basal body complex protein [Desulfovibrio sp. OttesenSCG-928-G15]
MISSLFIGATGLKSHSEGLSVITHNLSNVNTVGFKQISMQYSDLVSSYVTSPSNTMTNISQKGAGSMPGAHRVLHTQGGFETSNESTDLAISGIGFFGVTQNGKTHYTRAGNFRFDNQGNLLDPSGWNVLGRKITNGVENATPEPITLELNESGQGYMPSKATRTITSYMQLGGIKNNSDSTDNPFFSMASQWNATYSPPLNSNLYSHKEGFSFYDSGGNLRSGNIYYDGVSEQSSGVSAVEYIITLDPGQDGSVRAGTQAEGLLLAGTLTFASNGELSGFTSFSPPADGNNANLAGWTPASLANGKPAFTVKTTGGEAQTITFETGIQLTGTSNGGAGLANAAEAAGNPQAILNTNQAHVLGEKATTKYGTETGSVYSAQDGYAEGFIRSLNVTADGLVRASYSNSQEQDLYRVSTYRFVSQDGLRHEGNNHYSATPDSGVAQEGVPGSENFGTITGNAIEQSNVDYAREFSLLVVTQRGFQMNSKVITTSDTMLQRALELKR